MSTSSWSPFSSSFPTTILLVIALSVLLIAAMLYPTALLRWLQRKRYQYEVTFSLYMLTPTEKFIFNSLMFLVLSLVIIAVSLYLPEHLMTIANRVFYYWSGDNDTNAQTGSVGGGSEELKRGITAAAEATKAAFSGASGGASAAAAAAGQAGGEL